MTALAVRDDQDYWDKNQLAVLEQSGIEQDVTEAELRAFMHECQRRKLDPFSRQIYLIGRHDRRKGRKVYKSQTSIDGFRLIARRAADKSGIEYSYEDTIWYDAKGGRHEIWLSDQMPAGAKVVVIRNGCRFDAVARFGAYAQLDRDGSPTGQWRNMADVMVAKCAEALALRKAFPEDLGGIYTEEEMAQADNPQRVQAHVIHDEPSAESGPSRDQEWLTAAMTRATTLADDNDGRILWGEVIDKRNEGLIVTADAERIKNAIRARWKELAEETDAEAVQGTIVAELDPADPWALRIEEIASVEDAVAISSEVGKAISDGSLDDEKGAAVFAAIAARESAITHQAAA